MDEEFWDERYSTSELIWTGLPNLFLVRETQGLDPSTALDLACGEGRNAVWLAEQGWSVTGADFSSVGLEKARALAAQRAVHIDFEQHDATSWEPDERFGLVVVLYLQLPLPQRREALLRAAGAVAAGGSLLVVAHDRENLEHGIGGPQSPEVLYSVNDVVEIAELSGLEIVTAEQARRAIAAPGGDREAIDTVVRARRP
jgi:2-polyprenyl-3-methyl-5-hydroxy-6-metoxy-1,4-benzoquinol methylase